jgi:hypothetical protein
MVQKMFTHVLLVLPSPVPTSAARAQYFHLSSPSRAKCMVQESICLVQPFITEITLASAARVHPLTVIHPTVIHPSGPGERCECDS